MFTFLKNCKSENLNRIYLFYLPTKFDHLEAPTKYLIYNVSGKSLFTTYFTSRRSQQPHLFVQFYDCTPSGKPSTWFPPERPVQKGLAGWLASLLAGWLADLAGLLAGLLVCWLGGLLAGLLAY